MTTEATKQASDILAMSDDEILNMSVPPSEEVEQDTQNTPEEDVTTEQEEVVTTQSEETTTTDEPEEDNSEQSEVDEDAAKNLTSDKVDDKVDANEVDSNGKPITKAAPTTEDSGQSKSEEDKQSEGLPADFDYKAGYERLMAPFKANGKMITPQSPEEAISLMQMGANYTRKMQALQPYRKVMLMLENNGLMDEDKLSYLIDLDKKNPEAIRKLLKDSGTDPLDIDMEGEINYQKGNHRVSDTEAAFATELDDLKSTPEGQATLGVISQTWDEASKNALFENRGLLQTIQSQRENGIYDIITNEINRLNMLGQIPAGTPFIQAYNYVGDALAKQGAFNHLAGKPVEPKPEVTAQRAAVATRVVKPKPTVTHSEQASAASPSRAAPKKVERFINPLAMSDEEFAKLPNPGGL
ncbi:hypothetical protein D5Q97_23230 [Salmonella enterica]|uniref:Tape measure protein n=1 Tax=Salmonella enterica TaxID=28901 RepID=A0A5T9SK73_SALER|nr:hypothetical protein [Salmonella enterica]